MLVGRRKERAALDALVESAVTGRGSALLVVGEPGIGKTTLLDDAVNRNRSGVTVLRTAGREPSGDLPFACLADLLRPVEAEFAALPKPQARALRRSLGLEAGGAAVDGLSVGVAALGALAAHSRRTPLLVVVDDFQWVDEPSRAALLFTARRLDGHPIGMVIAVRGSELPDDETAGLQAIELEGLSRRDAAALLTSAVRRPIDRDVRRQLLEVSSGNPLALLEIPIALSDAQLAGTDPLGEPVPVNGSIERAFGSRIARLPQRTRSALLVIAAGGPQADEVTAAALRKRRLGFDVLAPAVADGLLFATPATPASIAFRHPVVRSIAYHRESARSRRAAHRLLADVEVDADRRAWHLNAAAAGRDDDVAHQLDAAGGRALGRGAPASAARAFEAAAALTADGDQRGRRLAAAARAAHRAGDVRAARRFSAVALDLTADPIALADLLLVESDLRMRDGDLEGAHRTLVDHARELVPIDPRRAATMLLLASKLRIYRLEAQAAADEVERALELLPRGEHDVVHVSALGMSRTVAGRRGARNAALAAATAAARAPHGHAHTLAIAWPLIWLEEYATARAVVDHALGVQREAGFLLYLPQALLASAELEFRTGEWDSARAAGAEARSLFDETQQPTEGAWAAAVLCRMEAARGQADACRELAQQALASDVEFALRSSSAHALAAIGLLALGQRRPEAAIAPLATSDRIAARGGIGEPWLLLSKPDLIEALARVGHEAQALEALREYEALIGDTGRVSALAAAARCAGILATGAAWRDDFEHALALHATVPTPFERARTELCYGERLRRARRRAEARLRLSAALETFEHLGAAPWAERARAELRASGQRTRKRATPIDELTPQELAVARLVADGLKNREAAATLFVSEKTVEFHLAGVYRKLGVRSRVELARLMATTKR